MPDATMTLNLTDREMAALESLAGSKGMSKTQIMRQALRLYQLVCVRTDAGERLFFEGDDKRRAEFFLVT